MGELPLKKKKGNILFGNQAININSKLVFSCSAEDVNSAIPDTVNLSKILNGEWENMKNKERSIFP